MYSYQDGFISSVSMKETTPSRCETGILRTFVHGMYLNCRVLWHQSAEALRAELRTVEGRAEEASLQWSQWKRDAQRESKSVLGSVLCPTTLIHSSAID